MSSLECKRQIASHIQSLLGADSADDKAFEKCLDSISAVVAQAEAEAIAGLPGTHVGALVAACHDAAAVD